MNLHHTRRTLWVAHRIVRSPTVEDSFRKSRSTIFHPKGLITDVFSWEEFVSIKLLPMLKKGCTREARAVETRLAPPRVQRGG